MSEPVTPDTLTDEQICSRIRAIKADPVRFAGSSRDLLEECRVALEAPVGSLRRIQARASIAERINSWHGRHP